MLKIIAKLIKIPIQINKFTKKINKIMQIKDKLLKYCELKKISKTEFSQITGVVNGFFNKGRGVGSENLESILRFFPDLSAEWLLRDEGKMIKEDNIIMPEQKCKEQPPSSQNAITEVLKTITDTNRILVDTNSEQTKQIGKLIDKLK